MNLKEVFNRGQSYPENFFYGDMLEVIRLYELQEGLFLLGKTSEETELLWGVNEIKDLKETIEKIKMENEDVNFIFRYAGKLDEVIEKKEIIRQWGYEEKDLYVGYFCDLHTLLVDLPYTPIEYLDLKDIDNFLLLDREIFNTFNISRQELIDWLNSEDYIILIYKEKDIIKGFVVMSLYGDNKQSCFVRSLGVCERERKKGIGKKLMLFGLKEAKKKGALKSMLWVDLNNIIARNLYEQIGYIIDRNEAEIIFRA
ncbi:GNAT family N-acetyltransferase [Tissierella sp. MSJ-40]|uniref:GNAT family N-acetyltransferase n=1 Tax=Tissierella simiarum TaxID=2841534 RepID=A0ABS6E3L1_9FIRM|nr:GNAT family N-acetyltransferase [Tissierella simiarum]MBU5437367.1 GNAT family N-acetyltransferase [Tissierella simiarum]